MPAPPPSVADVPRPATSRRLVPEVMDAPTLDPALHEAALRGLGRINRVSRSAGMLWPEIERTFFNHRNAEKRSRPFRVLDLACGGGDVCLALARRAARHGAPIEFIGADVSPVALEFARRHPDAAKYGVEFRQLDVLRDDLPRGIDLTMNSLFMHHLTRDQAVRILRKMRAASDTVLVNDLRRGHVAHAFTVLGTRLISRSPVVHIDGPRSVRAAWTPDELANLAAEAGLHDAKVENRFPWRMLMRWHRPNGGASGGER